MIKNILKYGSVLCMSALLSIACEKEELLEPSHAEEIYFRVPDDATDAVSQLRRDFLEETGIHLLFNDTLRKEYAGQDASGEAVYDIETVNFNYKMNSSTLSATYRFGYLETLEEMRQAAEFARQEILPHLGSNLKPYSLLLLHGIEVYEYNSDEWETDWWNYSYRIGWRCTALALGGLGDMDEAARLELKLSILKPIIWEAVWNLPYDTKAEFYAYSDDYYYADKEYDLGLSGEYSDEEARSFGFLYDTNTYYYPGEETDLNTYVGEALARTPEEFEAFFGAYPLVMAKYELVMRMMESVGYKF